MAKSYDEKIDKTIDWGGDETTGGLGVKGSRVQEFIKDQLEHRIGVLYYDTKANRYIAFADEINRDIYLNDTSRTDLIMATFDAPFNYTASIKLSTPRVNNILKTTTGNYIKFTFDTYNKEGSSVGESVICTYTFTRGTTKQEVSVKYDYLESVSFPIDEYLQTGSNVITINVQGQTTMAATSIAVVYNVIDLQLTDSFNISTVNDITDGQLHQLEIPYEVSGQGTKEMEWYIDGVALEYNKDEDEILESSSARIKYIDISNLSDGVHSLQFRVSTTVDGEKFYADTLYREFFVKAVAEPTATLLSMATTVPSSEGILTELNTKIYSINQYEPCGFTFAVFNPAYPTSTQVEVYVADTLESTLAVANETVESYSYTPYIPGAVSVKFVAEETSRILSGTVEGSSMGIQEITSGLAMDFRSTGKSNSSTDRDVFTYGDYTGEFSGFLWNQTSGWVDNALLINNGSTFKIDWSPLGNNPTNTGRTLEFSFCTTGVSNDAAEICSLMSDGVGLNITASEIMLTSREGKKVSTKFKSEEDVRISLVINRATGVTNKGLAFIYINGILSGATKFAASDSFTSDVNFAMSGTSEAEVKLYQIRAYNIALSSDQILNNYILYQNSTKDMQEIYYRNDITDSTGNALSIDKLEKFLPVMLITGNIPVLENTKNKKEQITVDVEYYNLQDPTKSFTMKSAAMTPQGTSSMSYPKKNFKLYTKKIEDTKVYDYQGNEIEDKLYVFKDGAQPVQTWCLKADYAESSSTHNTGIARLWNDAMYNASIDGEYKLRTEAQKAALANNYEYDVRTTVDGFPILMFYRLTETSDIIFIGKYNFNNDKSTESVFGFTDIPGFDNTKMQCWEVLNNGNHLALFQDVDNFDTEWADAFESRYPDVGDAADTTDLKAFATWLVGVKDDAEKFKTEKWNHLDVYKVAAYYIYLMRFGAVDQTVKNAMFTSEDGEHFYFINYDNDTINGVRNDGLLIYDPTITRQSLDASYSTTVYAYAGHDSTLWNMLEADSEFMDIVSVVDNALYQSGLRYSDVIDMFNIKQSSKWCEKIYNQDAQYKYIGPYVNDGIDNLYMLQGSRASHRQWWLSRRFNLVDSWYVSGAYKSNVLECKMASAPIGIQFSITAGYDMSYGYGVNNIVVEKGIELKQGESHTFTTKQVLNIGDPMRIYTANNLESVDLSGFIEYLSTVNIASVNDSILGTKLKELVLGDGTKTNTSLNEIQGLTAAKRLETLDISGYKAITSMDLSNALYLKTLNASNSGLNSVVLPVGSQSLTTLKLPESLSTLELRDLNALTYSGITIDNSGKNLKSITISNTPKCSDFSFVKLLVINATGLQSLYVDNINWTCSPDDLIGLVQDKNFSYSFFGKVLLTSITQEYLDTLIELFGSSAFDRGSAFYITAPSAVFLTGPAEIWEGETAKFKTVVFSPTEDTGIIKYSISSGSRTGASIDQTSGVLTTTENGYADSTLTIKSIYISTSTGVSATTTKDIKIKKRIYPTVSELSNLIAGTKELETAGETTTISVDLSGYPSARIASYAWSLTAEEEGYFEIVSQLNNTCKIKLLQEVTDVTSATLSLIVTKVVGGTIIGTTTIAAKNESIAISAKTNPYVMQAFYKAGLAANENYMTKIECALVTDDDLAGSYQEGFFYKNIGINKVRNITDFSEFRFFISLTKVPQAFFYCYSSTDCLSIQKIVFPDNIVEIGAWAFYGLKISTGQKFLDNLVFPKNLQKIGDLAFSPGNFSDKKYFTFDFSRLPDTLQSLIFNAFQCCADVDTFIMPKAMTKLEMPYSVSSSYVHIGDLYVGENYVTALNDDLCCRLGGRYCWDSFVNRVHIGKNQTFNTQTTGSSYTNYLSYSLSNKILYINDQGNTDFSSLYDDRILLYKDSAVFFTPKSFKASEDSVISKLFDLPIYENDSMKESLFSEEVNTRSSINISKNLMNLLKEVRFSEVTLTMYTISVKSVETLTISALVYSVAYSSGDVKKLVFDKFESFSYMALSDKTLFYKIETAEVSSSPKVTIKDNIILYNSTVAGTIKSSTGVFDLVGYTVPRYCAFYVDTDILTLKGSSSNNLMATVYSSQIIKTLDVHEFTETDWVSFENTEEFLAGLEAVHMRNGTCITLWRCVNLTKLYFYPTTAPSVTSSTFYNSGTLYVGKNTASTGENTLYVPANATGYDTGYWLDPLQNADKCGFKLSKTL